MKSIFACLLVLVAGRSAAQFNGSLIYQVDQNGIRLVMKYYQNGTHGKIEAYNVHLTNGVPDSTTMHAQDTIIFDFAAQTETHLQYHTMMAYKQKYMGSVMTAALSAKLKSMGTLAVSGGGADTANGYSCNHYVISTTSKLGTGTRDVWVSSSLGPSPTVWVVGSYLYFEPGYPHFVKLTAAGASGIVVQVNSSFTRQGLQYVMRLIGYDPHPPRLQFFSVPSRYSVIDETNMSFPAPKGN
jgi:hypothetical protein